MTRRLLVSQLLITFLVLVIAEVPLGSTYAARANADLRGGVERDAAVLASFAEDVLTGTRRDDLDAVAAGYQQRTGGRVVVVDRTGLALADSDPPEAGTRSFATRPEIAQALAGRSASGRRPSDTLGTDLVFVAVPISNGAQVLGALRVTHPTSEVDARVRRVWLTLAGVGIVTLVAAAIMAAALGRWVTRPVAAIQRAADNFGGGERSARAPADDGPPEVRDLAASFNEMADTIGVLLSAQESFVSDASHQLRTPLTALRLRLEVMTQRATTGRPPSAEDVGAAMEDVRRMSRLVDGLLTLARTERLRPSDVGSVDAAALLRERRTVWSALAEEEGVRVTLADGAERGPVTVRATEDRLSQVLDNLIANAVEASPEGGAVELAVVLADGRVELHVRDEGPGLSEDERRRAFDRFWRGSSESGTFGGSGLGLAIARQLTAADGGDLELRAAPGGGVDATVTLRPG